jgi:hypothetical protein
MAEIVAHVTSSGVPLTTPTTLPRITIRRLDTGAAVVTAQSMTEVGDGAYRYTFAPDAALEYSVMVDADPLAAGQVGPEERYHFGSFSGITIARIEDDIPRIKKVTANRVVVNGTDTQMDVYEDDDTSIAFSFSISADRRDRTPI